MFVRVEAVLKEEERPPEFTKRVNRSAEIGDVFRTFGSQFSTPQEKEEARAWLLSHGVVCERQEALLRRKKPYSSRF